MRDVSPMLAAMLNESHEVHSALACYYNGRPVADEIPVSDGSLEIDANAAVPGQLTATLPRFLHDQETGAVRDLLPTTDNAPLGCSGTQVAVMYSVQLPGQDKRESVDLGWFRITSWEEGDGTISITAASLECIIEEARLITPVSIAKGTSFAAAAKTLVGGLLPLRVTANAAKTASMDPFEEDRLAALNALVTAWPARMRVDPAGTLEIIPPVNDATDPITVSLTDGEDGTVMTSPTNGTRDGVYNAVRAQGEADGDVAPVSAVAYLSSGPRRWNGPYGNIPYFYSSPLLTTKAQAQAAAKTRLAALQVIAAPVEAEIAPDPRLEAGDVIELTHEGITRLVRLDSVSLPLTYAGTQTIKGHVIIR
jgi:hypothetical protein